MKATSVTNRPRPEAGPRLRWFKKGELTCAWPPCGKPMPAGFYGKQKRIYHCSYTCFQYYYFSRKKPLKCRYCGKLFRPRMSNGGKPYCSAEHFRAWQRNQRDKKSFGRFAPIAADFLADSKARLLSKDTLQCLRGSLRALFKYALRKRIRSVETIRTHHIQEFIAERKLKRPKSFGRTATDLHVFFDWAIRTKRRKALNPVILSFHGQKAVRGNPRPYSLEELALIRSLVDASGDLQLKLAIEIGAHSGLRIGEVANLRISDFDLKRQQFFVRLPTKTRIERLVPFHTRTKYALVAWLKQRPAVGHDYLFVCGDSRPMRKYTLRLHLERVLCGSGRLDAFSFHRLRHTAATSIHPALNMAGLMQTFGWKNHRVAQGYTQVDPTAVRKSYLRAMDRLENEDARSRPNAQSIEAYFAAAGTAK